MNEKLDLFEIEALTKKLNQIKNEYRTIDFKPPIPNESWYRKQPLYCKDLLFYVPGLNALYSTKTNRILYEDFVDQGGINSLHLNQLQKVDEIPYSYRSSNSIEIEKHFYDEFIKDHPYSGIDDYDKNDTLRYRDYENKIRYARYALCYLENPQIEKLMKTNLKAITSQWIARPSVLYKRNFKPGKNMNEITRLPKYAWQMMMLQNVLISDIKAWNEMRIWIQKDNLTKNQLQTIFNLNIYDSNQIKELRTILSAEWEGKRIFSIETLLNYLARLDMYQAINVTDALTILRDYIHMCKELNIKPITDSNSLKREHDVTARQYNEQIFFKHHQHLTEKFNNRYPVLAKYEYSDGRLQVIAPRNPEDMRNEGRNNRNCVASYADRVANGNTNIYFIRLCKEPEKSYITIEVDDEFTHVRQKFYAANRPVDKVEDLEFIEKWIEHNAMVPMLEEKKKDLLLDEKIKNFKSYKDSRNDHEIQMEQEEFQFEM